MIKREDPIMLKILRKSNSYTKIVDQEIEMLLNELPLD